MQNIKELVEKELTKIDFVRSKVACVIQEQLKNTGVTLTRGIVATIYNEIDTRYKELRKQVDVKFTSYSKVQNRINSSMELETVLAERHMLGIEYTPQESVKLGFELLEAKAKSFVKDPTEGRRKAISRHSHAMNSFIFILLQSEAPEDKTLAESYTVRVNALMEAIRKIPVLA